ncbi:MAG: hypothetical protein Q6M04_02060, partial [Thermostichus sp. BF3_bins_97]
LDGIPRTLGESLSLQATATGVEWWATECDGSCNPTRLLGRGANVTYRAEHVGKIGPIGRATSQSYSLCAGFLRQGLCFLLPLHLEKHELIDGRVYDMTGGTRNHSDIAGSFLAQQFSVAKSFIEKRLPRDQLA